MAEQNGNVSQNDFCHACFAQISGRNPCPVCGYDAEKPQGEDFNKLSIGTILNGRYLIGRTLGQGGFGITYLALDMKLGTKTAIKEYYPSGLAVRNTGDKTVMVASEDSKHDYMEGLTKFLDEARILGRFDQNPNIVSVKDFFEYNRTAYMVMSYLEGGTMLQYLKAHNGKISFEEATRLLFPIMDALDIVHGANLIHRDISPDNVFITNDGQVRLLDFGAAKNALALANQKSHSVVLKKGYSPAEQYQTRGQLGPWSDVYSMGATLYRSITGELPPDAVDRLGDEDPIELPSAKGAVLPDYAERAIMRALSLSASQRFQSMGDFKNALSSADFKAEMPPIAKPVNKNQTNRNEKSVKESEHHGNGAKSKQPPYALIAAAVFFIACVGGGIFYFTKSSGSNSTYTASTGGANPEFDNLMAKAQEGDRQAQYYIGQKFQQGKGVPLDMIAASEWFRKSAEQGFAPAQCDLGALYFHGNGVPQDYEKAAEWLEKAAEQKIPIAMSNLAYMYENGYGVAHDLNKAVSLYKEAADKGNASAQTKMGSLYVQGHGVKADPSKAVEYWKKAGKQGVAEAQFGVGYAYLMGKGVPYNKNEAVKWLRMAAEQGYEDAQNALNGINANATQQTKPTIPTVKQPPKPAAKPKVKAPKVKVPEVKKPAVKKTTPPKKPANVPTQPKKQNLLPPGL
ncbi:MAG: serine/threonine-protein kinase [Synergistes sp.]|nr:serine/threonine-protein kinase [Synergistes sp.]